MQKTIRKLKKILPISVFIIAKNEQDRIAHAIKSVSPFADEVIVVDSGSEDNTIKTAKEAGADRVIFHEWQGYGLQKAYAESLCKHNWVLNLDADEIVSKELSEEIIAVINSEMEDICAYKVKIKITPRFSKNLKLGPQDVVIRLYDKTRASYSVSPIHDSVIVKEGRVGQLKYIIEHNCFRSYAHAVEKINMYTSMQAQDMFNKGKCPSVVRICVEPFWTFLKAYLLNFYIFFGLEGLMEAYIYSFSKTLRLIKAREKFLQHGK